MINLQDKKIHALLAGLFAIGFILIIFSFWQRLSFPEDWRIFDTNSRIILTPNEPITQTFHSTNNNLAQINLLLRNDNLQFGERLIVEILDENCSENIRTASLEWPHYAPKQYDYFSFEPITDSNDKIYCLKITYKAKEKRKEMPYISTMKETGNSTDQFIVHAKKTDKIFNEQSFIFRPAYEKNTAGETVNELARRISAYKADFLRNNFLLLIIYGFIIVTITLVFLVITL